MLLRYAKIKIWSFVVVVCWWWSFIGTKNWNIKILGPGLLPSQNKAEATLFQVKLSRKQEEYCRCRQPPTPTPPPREKQLSPSENLQCGDISALVTEATLITAQKSDANAAFVGGKASPAHLLSWRVEAAAGLSEGGVTREHRRLTRLILAKELMIHFGFGGGCEQPSVETRERQRRHTQKSVFTRLQTASNEGKQPKRVHPGWDGGLWRMLVSAQDTFNLAREPLKTN